MDGSNLFHKDAREVIEMIKWIESNYSEIWAKPGQLHDHLGMVLDYQEKGTVKIIMETYTIKVLE